MDRHLLPDEIDQLVDGDVGFGTPPLKMHVRQCATCRTALEEARALARALDRLPRLAPSPAFAETVLARVQVFTPWHVALMDAVRAWTPRSRPARVAAGALAGLAALGTAALSVWLIVRAYPIALAVELALAQGRAAVLGAAGDALAGALGDSAAAAVRDAGPLGIAAAIALLLAAAAGALSALHRLATVGRRHATRTLPQLVIAMLVLGAPVHLARAQGASAPASASAASATSATGGPQQAKTAVAMRDQGPLRAAHPTLAGTFERPPREQRSVPRALGLAVAWLVLLTAIGAVVLRGAPARLDSVVHTLAAQFTRSAAAGVLAELLLLPAVLLGLVALALTVVGILAIPIAIVAAVVVVAGAVVLGLLAMAYVGGAALLGPGDATGRRPRTALLVAGLAPYFALWVLASVTTRVPVLGGLLWLVSALATWAAATAGVGAIILSQRAGHGRRPAALAAAPEDDFIWQTPTPVSGVVAARRPTPVAPPRQD